METLALAGRIEWKERFSKEHFQNSICEVIDSVWRSGGDRAMRSNRDPAGAQGSEYPRGRNPPAVHAHPAKEDIVCAGRNAIRRSWARTRGGLTFRARFHKPRRFNPLLSA